MVSSSSSSIDTTSLATFTGHSSTVRSVVFSPDGKTLASRQPIGEPLTGDGYAVLNVAFSPDGKTLASSRSNMIQLWDVASRQPLGKPLIGVKDTLGVLNVAFSPDGKTLAFPSGEKDIKLWKVGN
ncbi:MAG: hypothetical protein WCS37_03040 [Chloroflexota bacterium]